MINMITIYREVVLPSGEKLSKSTPGGVPSGTLLGSPQGTELINTVTKERKVFPSLRAVALYLRELNPEYKASSGSPRWGEVVCTKVYF